MKFNCSVESFYSSLSAVSHALSTKGSLPVLSYILLEASGKSLSLSATNLELAITTVIEAEIEKEGSVCAPGKLLTDLASSLPSGEIKVSVKDNILDVESQNVKSKLNGIASTEFPKLALGTKEEFLSLDPAQFCKSLPSVIFSAATDESRPVLTGVLFDVTEDVLTLVGVDGFRLSERKLKLTQKADKHIHVVIPARPLSEIGRLISGEGSLKVFLDDGENQIIFRTERFEISSRLIEGAFPDYRKIIPASFISRASVPAEEFRKSVKLASLFAKDSSNVIKITLSPSESLITLGANTPEIGENETKISARIEGEGLNVAFNNRYLSDCLSNITDTEIIFQASGELSPGLFTSSKDENFLHIIMPVRVQE